VRRNWRSWASVQDWASHLEIAFSLGERARRATLRASSPAPDGVGEAAADDEVDLVDGLRSEGGSLGGATEELVVERLDVLMT
jgi:hypothetical protein